MKLLNRMNCSLNLSPSCWNMSSLSLTHRMWGRKRASKMVRAWLRRLPIPAVETAFAESSQPAPLHFHYWKRAAFDARRQGEQACLLARPVSQASSFEKSQTCRQSLIAASTRSVVVAKASAWATVLTSTMSNLQPVRSLSRLSRYFVAAASSPT